MSSMTRDMKTSPSTRPGRRTGQLSTTQAAKRLRVNVHTVQKWFDQGFLTGVMLPAGHRRISVSSLEDFMARHAMNSHTPALSRVLIVEDDLPLQKTLKAFLTLEGTYEIRTASSGIQAGLLLAEFRPQWILLDVMLEDVHGAELVRQIRASEAGRAIRIIAMSGTAEEGDKRAALMAGAEFFLQKPFPLADLRKAMQAKQPRHAPGAP